MPRFEATQALLSQSASVNMSDPVCVTSYDAQLDTHDENSGILFVESALIFELLAAAARRQKVFHHL